jgi:hypothetical protein
VSPGPSGNIGGTEAFSLRSSDVRRLNREFLSIPTPDKQKGAVRPGWCTVTRVYVTFQAMTMTIIGKVVSLEYYQQNASPALHDLPNMNELKKSFARSVISVREIHVHAR